MVEETIQSERVQQLISILYLGNNIGTAPNIVQRSAFPYTHESSKTLERLKHAHSSRAGPYLFLTLQRGSSFNDTNQNYSYHRWLKFYSHFKTKTCVWESARPVTLFDNTASVATPTFHRRYGNATLDIPDIQYLSNNNKKIQFL